MKEFDLSEMQSQAILEMQLQRLDRLERDKIDAEYARAFKENRIMQGNFRLGEKRSKRLLKKSWRN